MQRRLSIPSILSVAAILLATVLIVPVFAGSPFAQATGNSEVPEFEYNTFQPPCDGDFSHAVYPATDGGEAIDTPIEVDPPVDNGEGVTVTFRVPELAGGEYIFERICDPGEDTQNGQFRGDSVPFSFSRVLLTKDVTGDVPDDTTFVVNTDCAFDGEPLLAVDREFGADGGEAQVVFYESSVEFEEIVCTITETEDGDAQSHTVEPGTLSYTDYADGSSTVTNTFPAAEPEPEPEPEPSPSPTEDVGDTVEEAEPAEPVEAEPDFTG